MFNQMILLYFFCLHRKTGRQVSTTSTRGHRLAVKPPKLDNANRRQFGKGLVGRMLNRTIRRKRLTSEVRKQLEHLTDHRFAVCC